MAPSIRVLVLGILASTAALAAAPATPSPAYEDSAFQALEYRNIGPYRGGRVTAVTGVRGELRTFYMGSTGGGVWRSDDGGVSWKSLADDTFGTASVGAVEVAPSDPNVVWVGMGSTAVRGNVSPGDGVYRSTDGGASWQHVGLEEAGQIGRVRVDPRDPDRAYVAALGHLFGPNPERGVFRTTDGGKTWEKVLFVSDRAGAVDLIIDSANPRFLYAATWEVMRHPWELVSGGEGSGLYKSTDGGDSWQELTEGLPEGMKGRIGVAVSPARPGRVWALVEAADGGLFRSDDGGEHFRRVNADRMLRQRAWYYTRIYADSRDPETVYVVNVLFHKSVDGGKTFTVLRVPHGDNHDLWINPDHPEIMIEGNDGGAVVSFNGGATWSTQMNQPTAEFYRVTVDDQFPYRVYGAQQDNSTVSIASRTAYGGIGLQDWYDVGGGESGHIAVRPDDPDIVYAGSYGGEISRYDHATGELRSIMVYPQQAVGQQAKDLEYRFQWNAPIRISPHDPHVLYQCSQVVLRSTDDGRSWQTISPDLTRDAEDKEGYSGGPITWDNTGVEVYSTIFAFEESPLTPGVLWAGSDDGLVHLSRDGGESWSDVTPKGMPEWGTVNMIELSSRAEGRAYLAVQRYRLDDFRPYVFRTDDYGATWTLLTDGENGIPSDHFVRVVREDPEREGLLYAGTEMGMYVSFDGGRRWQPLQLKLPVTPITDLAVKDGDLVVATQGRAFWILDDLGPLRQLSPEAVAEPAHLFEPRPAVLFGGGFSFGGSGAEGKNPPAGAFLYYHLAEEPKDEVVLEILDGDGNVLRHFSSKEEEPRAPNPFLAFLPPEAHGPKLLPTEKGLNRWVWDLRHRDARLLPDVVMWGVARGPQVAPGTYQVRLKVGDQSRTRSFEVVEDPRLEVSTADLQAREELALEVREQLERAHDGLRAIRTVRSQARDLAGRLEKVGKGEGVQEAADGLVQGLTAVEEKLTQTKTESIQDPLNFPPRIDSQLLYLLGEVEASDARPTEAAYRRFDDLKEELDGYRAELDRVLEEQLTAFQEVVRSKDAPPVLVPEKER